MATAHDQSDDEPRQASPDNPLFVGKLPAGVVASRRPALSSTIRRLTGTCQSLLVGGSSELNQATQITSKLPALPVRLLVNRYSTRRSSGYTHGPRLRLPPHCQACQRSLTRKRSLVQIQYRPPPNALVRGTISKIITKALPASYPMSTISSRDGGARRYQREVDTAPSASRSGTVTTVVASGDLVISKVAMITTAITVIAATRLQPVRWWL